MHILVINVGSSSLKFTLFGAALDPLAGGIVERIGLSETRIRYRAARGDRISMRCSVTDTRSALDLAVAYLTDPHLGCIPDIGNIRAVGHRVVHGGERIKDPVLVDAAVKEIIRECIELAPLHNPPNLMGIEAAEQLMPGAVQVAVFDTAFHATIPEHAYLYGLPHELCRRLRIRRYGFHGISHQFVSREAARMVGRPLEELRLVTCHLGNGSSVTAIDRGMSIDTSMGFTPLEGLMMGTRCGDLDPAIVPYIVEHEGMSAQEVSELLNRQSGLYGLAGIGSSDLRDIREEWLRGNRQAESAIRAFCYRVKKYIGAYSAALGGLDALVFTAGIGENAAYVRGLVCEGLEGWLGSELALDTARNEAPQGGPRAIHCERSKIQVLVIPTNEEKEIAYQTLALLTAEGVGRDSPEPPGRSAR